jgi:GlcNAc-P-P-Und epimerase
MNKEIMIIGGAGFVGTRLPSRFDIKNIRYSVGDIDTSNRTHNVLKLDVEIPTTLKQVSAASAIINLAAIHRDDVRPLRRYNDVNVVATRTLSGALCKVRIDSRI